MTADIQIEHPRRPTPEREKELLFPKADSVEENTFHNRLVVEGFIEGYPGRVFTIRQICEEMPWKIEPGALRSILDSCDNVVEVSNEGEMHLYLSTAPQLKPTCQVSFNKGLGYQACKDFYELVNHRARNIKRKKYFVTEKY